MMRKNEDGTIHTWLATDRASGESVRVDDRTFDPALHEDVDAGAVASDELVTTKSPKAKGKKR